MLTFYHAPHSRSWRILALIEEMGLQDWITTRPVDILRFDGSGAVDPANPHPEGKVPILDHDGHLISETPAIMIYLTTIFPGSAMAPATDTPEWGEFLAWMCWYTAAMEPALLCAVAEVALRWEADRVVAEANNGGAMVGAVLRGADIALPVRLVHAARGKVARAEPIAAAYEAGRVRHAGLFGARRRGVVVDGEEHDIGLVGDVVQVDPTAVLDLLDAGRIPVVSTIAPDLDADGQVLNVNADTAAAALAAALGARKLVVLTDVEGVYANWPDRASLLSQLSVTRARRLLESVDAGMIPKLDNSFNAIQEGVSEVVILHARNLLKKTGTRLIG